VIFNSKKYCIFHFPDPDKKGFWEEFDKLVKDFKANDSKVWDFEGFVFPDTGRIFERETFPKNIEINFAHAHFKDKTSFNETHFLGGVDFSNAVFLGETKLSNAHYYVKTSFANTEFKGVSYILNAYFHSNVDFSGAKFYKNTYFRESEFLEESEAKFNEAKFLNGSYVEFNRAVFTGVAKFNKAEFTGLADFTGVKFLNKQGEAKFVDAKFLGETYFKGTIFESYATFHGTIFEKKVDFWGPTFLKGSNFKNVKFFDRVVFTNTKFSGEVYFSDAKLEDVKFHSTNFSAPVSFKGAYVKKIDFDRSTFAIQPSIGNLNALSKDIAIINLVCDTSIEFSQGYKTSEDDKKDNDIEEPLNITVRGGSYGGEFFVSSPLSCFNCERCTFTGILIIDQTIKQENNSELPELQFERVNILSKTVINKVKINNITNSVIGDILILRDADLTRASFEGTSDLRRIDFINVTWPIFKRNRNFFIRSLRKLNALYDELKIFGIKLPDNWDFESKSFLAPKPKKHYRDKLKEKERQEKLGTLAEMYRAVATSYESRQRYGSARPFKVGEFDMRKRMNSTTILGKFVLRAYRFFSSIGESVVKPLVGLLLIWLIPAFCYFFFGELVDVSNGLVTTNICFTKAISLSFQACLPVKTSLVDRLVENWSWLPSLQRGLFAIFTAFFLFALRRKAKR